MPDERPRLWVELCAGSAAVTLGLLGGRHARPPISYMGSKNGYKIAVLGAMGLRCGLGADAVFLCDAGPWAHIYATLADPDNCREVASILRGWADEDPRALWERLREEHKGEWDGWTAERAAGWICITSLSGGGKTGTSIPDPMQRGCNPRTGERFPWTPIGIASRVESVAGWLYVGAHCAQGHGIGLPLGIGAFLADDRKNPKDNRASGTTPKLAHRVESVAAWSQVNAWSRGQDKAVPHGYDGPGARAHCASHKGPSCDDVAGKLYPPRAPVAIYAGPAEDLHPPDDCDGVYCYADPPYEGTTGYAATMPRETVLDVARRWSDAGAVVCVSEAEPLPLDGWHHVEITGARVGQKRTFSKQKREWLTMNREPAYRPATQQGLF